MLRAEEYLDNASNAYVWRGLPWTRMIVGSGSIWLLQMFVKPKTPSKAAAAIRTMDAACANFSRCQLEPAKWPRRENESTRAVRGAMLKARCDATNVAQRKTGAAEKAARSKVESKP
jgi:hypothetical protein